MSQSALPGQPGHGVTVGALIIASGFVVSKIVGLIARSLLLARFGAGDITDVYQAAFKLPDLIFNIIVLGALSAAFVPVFLQYWDRGSGQTEAWRLTNAMLTVLTVIVGSLALLGVLAAPVVVPWLAPGFGPEKQQQTIELTRIMLLATLFFSASNVVSGVLTALRRFLNYSLAPVLYNLGIIAGILLLYPLIGITGLAWGVVLGSFFHLAVQLPELTRAGFRSRFLFAIRDRGVRRVLKLMAPRTIGLAVTQIEQTVSLIIASTLAAGSVTVLAAANDLQSVPLNIFGVSMAVSVFPLFSQAFQEQNTAKFVEHFSRSIRRILLLIVPTTVLLLVLRAHIVRVIFGFGQFDWTATKLTAQALGLYSLSLFAQSLVPILARSFYAFQDTKTPVLIGLLTVPIDIGLAFFLSHLFGVLGIVLAFSISSVFTMLLLFAVLRIRLGDLDDRSIIRGVGWILLASLAMAAVIWLMLRFLVAGVDQHTRVGILLQGGVAGVTGLLVYVAVLYYFVPEEIGVVRRWIQRALRFGGTGAPANGV